MNRNNESGNNAEMCERRLKAYDLRLRGKTYRQIGAELGISQTQAMKDVKKRIDEIELPGVEEIRKQEVDRLLRYLEVLEHRIDMGDDKAVSIAIKVSERLCKMLGVDMPAQTEVQVTQTTQVDLAIQELIAAQKAQNMLNKDVVREARAGIDDE